MPLNKFMPIVLAVAALLMGGIGMMVWMMRVK